MHQIWNNNETISQSSANNNGQMTSHEPSSLSLTQSQKMSRYKMFFDLQQFLYTFRFETIEHTFRLFDIYLLTTNQFPNEHENPKIFFTCFLIASKFVELLDTRYSISDLLAIFKCSYTISEILLCEQEILIRIGFNMNFDTLSKIYWKKYHKKPPSWSIWLYLCASITTSIERIVEVVESTHVETQKDITKEMLDGFIEKLK